MSNKYWKTKDGKRIGPTMCSLTDKECVGITFCSLCPIETEGLTYDEYQKRENHR